MNVGLNRWLQISFVNLLIVSIIGVVLRYKIAFSLPIIDQKHLLHAHSHFAFSGWLSQVLMALMVHYLSKKGKNKYFQKYRWLLLGNLITAYGMLVFFPIQGYGLGSIIFSTLSIVNAYLFAIVFWKDLNALHDDTSTAWWFKAALVFNALSSLGAFSLAYMMANKIAHQNWYLSAVYFFLHFQYNGWFFFSGMGLLFSRIESLDCSRKFLRAIFWLFAGACVPAYFLSALWMPIPQAVYWLVIAASLAQMAAWVLLLKFLLRNLNALKLLFHSPSQYLALLAAAALSIKLLLQIGSTHPALSQLAFGFRPIVIGYLHLVLLGVISIFIFSYVFSMQIFLINKQMKTGIWIFVSGIIINEILLMVQGVAGLQYDVFPFINELLLLAACILFLGLLTLNWQLQKQLSTVSTSG
jgi:hypothetical protein